MIETSLILTEITASISEFKKNPMGIIAAGEGFPIAILNRNKPAFYCIPVHAFEVMMEKIVIVVIAVGRRDRGAIYKTAAKR